MRIAIVAPLVTAIREPQLGGSQSVVADLATGLTGRGHDVEVFAAGGSRIDGVHVVDTGIDPSSLSSSLFRAEEIRPRTTPASRRAFEAVYSLVRRDAYDVVHNHAFDAPAFELATDLDAPVVHTLHLGPDPEIASALAGVAGFARVVCVSEWLRGAWERTATVHAVIRNGVPVDRIPWSDEAGPAALCAGRLSPEKGVAEAIEIAIAADRPIVVAGSDYDADYAAALRRRYSARVDFVGALPRPRLWDLMSRSCALLCPVAWDEPFGLTAAEAQAAGTPVVAFRRGALGEVVADGVTGALVRDVPGATRALAAVARFDRRACRAHAQRALSLDTMLDAHEELYRRLVARVGTERP